MTRQSRSQALWNEAKRVGGDDIREMIESVAVLLRETVREKAQDVYDRLMLELTTRLATVTTQVTTALATKAPVNHTHPRTEVTGLNPALAALEARIAALEAKVP